MSTSISKYYNKLVVQETPYSSEWMMDTNHLRQYLGDVQPQQMDTYINSLFMNRKDYSAPFISALEMKASSTMLLTGTSDSWSWDFDKPIIPAEVLENLEIGNATPGLGKEVFKIKLDRDWFTYGDVITADRFSGKQIRVIPDGIQRVLDGWIYSVQLVSDDETDYYPAVFLDRGTQYRKLYSIYGEHNDQGTKVLHGGKLKMMNSLAGEIRTDFSITDWADALTLTVSSVNFDETGKPIKVNDSRWFKRAEMAAWAQHRRMKEDYLVFGKSGNNMQSPSGYDVTTSMGLWQMLHLGNVNYYSNLSLRKLTESIMDMLYGRTSAEERNVELYTGEAGMILFHDAVTRGLWGLGGLIPLEKFIDGRGMNMSFGYQFKAYSMPNGGVITLKHLKTLDTFDTKTERGSGRFSRLSSTFIGLDMSPDATDNIKIVKRNTRQDDYWGYIPGTAGPYGPIKGGLSASKKAGYDMWIYSRLGLHIEDITKTFILKPTFDY
jgi:hypothetical protein